MNWLRIVMKSVLAIPVIIQLIEEAFDGEPDSGARKKEMAKEFFRTILTAALGMSGAELDVVLKLADKMIDPVIDIMCAIFLPHEDKEVIG